MMWKSLLLIFLVNIFVSEAVEIIPRFRTIKDAEKSNQKYYALTFKGLVERHNGYTAEEFIVTTQDGYHLKIHRISAAPSSPKKNGKPVVFLQHGILGTSDTWVLFEPDNALAYLLANAGYDVWLGNIRGNTNSRSHHKLNPDDREFWNFSFHEMATKDLPVMIDLALRESGQTRLTYIGHSMGTLLSYILLAEKPEYNQRINLIVSLAPVGYWQPETSGTLLSALFGMYTLFTVSAEDADVFPQTSDNIKKFDQFCPGILRILCNSALRTLFGHNIEQISTHRLRYTLAYFPAGTSLKNMEHFVQLIKSGELRQYDYNNDTANIDKYNQIKPPTYDLSKVTAPVMLIYGKNDPISVEANVQRLSNHLSNVVICEAVPSRSFTHLDFLWAKDGKTLLYDRLLTLIELYRKK